VVSRVYIGRAGSLSILKIKYLHGSARLCSGENAHRSNAMTVKTMAILPVFLSKHWP
jgi:hypothetical protein